MKEGAVEEARGVGTLKGWKIDIRSYTVDMPIFNATNEPLMQDGKQVMERSIINVQEDIASLLFHSGLQLEPSDMFKAKDLADKIRAANDYVLLDNSEMSRIMTSYKLLKGLPERYIEFLQRIRDAEEISLKEDSPTSI